MNNQKGFVLIAISLVLGALGLVGTGVLANMDHEKTAAQKRDLIRVEDIKTIQTKLNGYFAVEHKFPEQKNESINGQEVLKTALGDIPADPLSASKLSYLYWSNGEAYTLVYFSETKRSQEMVFGP